MRKKPVIECEMEERWIPHFLSLFREMQRLGNIGSSRLLGFFADGDGDFQPKFKFHTDKVYEDVEPKKEQQNAIVDKMYDAG